MKEMTGGQLHHYKVSERKDKNEKGDKINFVLEEFEFNIDEKMKKRLDNLSNEVKQKGGQSGSGCYDYLSDSSSYYCNKYKGYPITPYMPISNWWYWPQVYELDIVYMPTFIAPLIPYVTILM